MKRVWQILIDHPIAIIAYILYRFCCYEIIRTLLWFHNDFKETPGANNIGAGELIGFERIFFGGLVFIYAGIILLNALFRKQPAFYWWLLLAIIIPPIIIATI